MSASIGLLGAGRMGGALLAGWAAQGLARDVVVFETDPQARDSAKALGASGQPRLTGGHMRGLDTLVLAVKPQTFDEAVSDLAADPPPGLLVISVMAGVTLDRLRTAFVRSHCVRAMPTTPAAVGSGIAAFVCGQGVTDDQRARAQRLLSATGDAVEVADEGQMDAVTAVSGSGPAYVFLLAEALAQAGAAQGLDPAVAKRLAHATVTGAGAMLAEPGADPAVLRANVTSPGGTTAAAMSVLENVDGLRALMARAVEAAASRSRELGQDSAAA